MKMKRPAPRAEKDLVSIHCPECKHSWSVDAKKEDLTADKECPACSATFTPTLSDYAPGIQGPASRSAGPRTTKQKATAAGIDLAAIFAARNRETVGRASVTDPAALYRERNARGGK
jgi:hypothetical protein